MKNDAVISTGYNGSPRGFENCCDIGDCPRMKRNMHQGEGYAMCRAVHAEANAILRVGDGDENYRVISAKELNWCVREEE